MNVFRRHLTRSVSLGYILRNYRSNIIVPANRRLGDCLILITEYRVIRETILKTISRSLAGDSQLVGIQSDSQLVNAINRKDMNSKRHYKLSRIH